MESERCCLCDDPTGRAGVADDSIYVTLVATLFGVEKGDPVGPLCLACYYALEQLSLIDEE